MTNYDRLYNAITKNGGKGGVCDALVDVLQDFIEADYVSNSYTSITDWLAEEHEITWEDVENLRKTYKVIQKANILRLHERENCKSEWDWDTHNLLGDFANLLQNF